MQTNPEAQNEVVSIIANKLFSTTNKIRLTSENLLYVEIIVLLCYEQDYLHTCSVEEILSIGVLLTRYVSKSAIL